jgi:hypothetical protein
MMTSTHPASEPEYRNLLRELGQVGYTRLRIVQRMTPAMLQARRAQLRG